MKNLFKFNSAEEFEIRNENLVENIEDSDEPLIDNNNIEANLDEAILFFQQVSEVCSESKDLLQIS